MRASTAYYVVPVASLSDLQSKLGVCKAYNDTLPALHSRDSEFADAKLVSSAARHRAALQCAANPNPTAAALASFRTARAGHLRRAQERRARYRQLPRLGWLGERGDANAVPWLFTGHQAGCPSGALGPAHIHRPPSTERVSRRRPRLGRHHDISRHKHADRHFERCRREPHGGLKRAICAGCTAVERLSPLAAHPGGC